MAFDVLRQPEYIMKYLLNALWTRIDSRVFPDLDDQENGKPRYNAVVVQHNIPVPEFHTMESEKEAYNHYDEYFLALGGLISRGHMNNFDNMTYQKNGNGKAKGAHNGFLEKLGL